MRSKVTNQVVINELARGKSRSAIARKYGVTPQAISKRVLSIVNQDNVQMYDSKLDQVLKSASMSFVSDSLEPAKLKKSSTLQSMTAAGICLTHLQGLPKTQINIQVVQQRLTQSQDERSSLLSELSNLRATPGLEIADTAGVAEPHPIHSLSVNDADQVSMTISNGNDNNDVTIK